MTNRLLFTNNATTTLAAGISPTSPVLQVVGGSGSLFPNLFAPNLAFLCTLQKLVGNPAVVTAQEIVLVQSRSGDTFGNMLRGQEGTIALAWNAGDTVALLPTAGGLAAFAQAIDVQGQIGNYAPDVGSANAYKAILTPALNGHVIGMPIRFKAGHSNTANCTFNDGIGVAALVTPSQNDLLPGDIIAGGIYTAVWDGTRFCLQGAQHPLFTQLVGLIANGQVPLSAVLQWEAELSISFTQLAGALQIGQMPGNYPLPGSPTTTTQTVGDASTKIATTAFVNPGSSFGTVNYRKNPDGSIHQWGIATISGTTTVILPVTFPNFCRSVVVTAINSTNQFNLQAAAGQSSFIVQNGSGQVYWEADGN